MVENEAILLKEEEDEELKPILGEVKKQNIAYRFTKRFVDIIGGIVGLIILIPMTIILFVVKIFMRENDGPIFYKQSRVGKNGKKFKVYKYRSMCVNADEKLKEYLEENEKARKEFKKYHKLKCDPRITKVGKVLRATSLDEFPQLINVLKGDMSLVGPRPVTDEEVEAYGSLKRKFLSVKPGLTGYWQVNGRSNTEYDDRIKMELYYVDNASIMLDFKILLKTFVVVIKKDGAC